jgi:dihydroorotate dehydrogenase
MDIYKIAKPVIGLLDAENAHRLAVRALTWGLVPGEDAPDDPILASRLWGRDFPNPVGLAAGFDKNAEVADALLALGFGFVELGSVTPRPQAGNPRPRLFRLDEDRAVINRMGFNNDGLEAVAARLAARPRLGLVGANLGKNKETEDAAADYQIGVARLAPLADYLVINVSSPNTPGLRALQSAEALEALARRAKAAMPKDKAVPLLLKVAPDLTAEDRQDIARVALAEKLDGLIVTNTTLARPDGLRSRHKDEAGGLSGQPLFAPSTFALADFHRLTRGTLPLIGVGGVGSGRQAYAKIRAGASLVQLYSALVFEGPALVGRVKRELAQLLRADGFTSLAQAVGADHC